MGVLSGVSFVLGGLAMGLPAKYVTCPCGESIRLGVEKYSGEKESYDVCSVECVECGRRSCGGNGRDGTVNSWITRRDAEISERNYEAMCFDADMNEWYGRGEW